MPQGVDLDTAIERLSARRQALWAGASEEVPGELGRITAKLAELWEAKRSRTARPREEVQRQARVELELERLANPEPPRKR